MEWREPMLTTRKLETCKPAEKPVRLFDTAGLYCEIAPKGGKWWRFRYKFRGKEKRISLGVFPTVSLAAARAKRDEMRTLLLDGIDPAARRRAIAESANAAATDTFESIAREWHSQQSSIWSEGHAERVINRLEKEIFPFIGGSAVTDISAVQVLDALRKIVDRGLRETAHRARADCSSIFRFAILTGRATSDPCIHLRGAIPPVRATHFAAVTEPRRVGELMRAIHHYSGDPVTRAALRLLPLVIVRPGELRHARWSEFDLEEAMWRIPAGRMKMRREHVVPLSRQAVALLKALAPLTSKVSAKSDTTDNLVFPGLRSSDRPISENTLNGALRRLGFSQEEMTSHGFRAMASTLLHEQGWNSDAIERQLAHSPSDHVKAAYHRGAHLAERRKMMQSWADFLDQLAGDGPS